MKHKTIEKIKHGLIVSCQAYDGDPLYGSETMAKMAKAAEKGGAVGIRANGVRDIHAIKSVTTLPMIGIIKEQYVGSDVYITPTFKELELLGTTDAEIIAIDGTLRKRPNNEQLKKMIYFIKNDLKKLVMADVSTLEEGIKAAIYGADFIAPTLSGYTKHTKHISGPDWQLLKDLVKHVDIPIIAEGKIMTGADAAKALKIGSHAVCVGTAITRPEVITQGFVAVMHNANNH